MIPVQTAVVSGASKATASTTALAAETRVATEASAAYSQAMQVQGAVAVQTAVRQHELAAAERASAVAHGQAARGIAAESAALLGLRGATLAASGPFLAATVGVIALTKAIKEASDTTEELNKTAVIFGQSAGVIDDFAKTTATSLGISSEQALEAAGIFGNLFRSIQIGKPAAAAMSVELVKLASDLASFNNADPSRTLEALRAGLVGQARPLRVFGVFLSQARAQQEALIETGKDNVKSLTTQEIVQARYNIILKDTKLAQGDFARTSDRLANQSRILKARISDLAATTGEILLPVVLLSVSALNQFAAAIQVAASDVKSLVDLIQRADPLKFTIKVIEDVPGGGTVEDFVKRLGFLKPLASGAAGTVSPALGFVVKAGSIIEQLQPKADKTAGAVDHLGQSLERASEHGRGAANGIGVAVDQVNHLLIAAQNAASALEIMNLKIQTGIAPGGRPAQEANLLQQIEQDKKAVAAADSGTKAMRQALEELARDQQALAALQEQDQQDTKDRIAKRKRAAAEQKRLAEQAAQAQQEATQAFIDSFAPQQQRLQNRLTTAQLFGTFKQQIALNKLIVAQDKKEIDAIKDRIRHLKLHGDALKIAKATIDRLNQEIFDTQNAILQLQSSRKQAIADARQSHLEAQLAIAETTKSTRDDTAAEKALIAFDKAQIRRLAALKKRGKATRDEIAQLDAYRVDLAQRNEALKKLKKEQETGNQTAKEFFNFLQTQAGFAANLLGNLIPGSATAGLVGGTANAASVVGGFGQPGGPQPGGGVIPGMAVTAASATAGARDRGVRPIQVDTTNQLLRHILRVLQNQTGRMGHPEARYQKATSNAVLDTEHGHG